MFRIRKAFLPVRHRPRAVRGAATARWSLRILRRKARLLVMGGSLGAQKLNELLRAALPKLWRNIRHHPPLRTRQKGLRLPCCGYTQYEYIDQELPDLFALADVVLSRAGRERRVRAARAQQAFRAGSAEQGLDPRRPAAQRGISKERLRAGARPEHRYAESSASPSTKSIATANGTPPPCETTRARTHARHSRYHPQRGLP